MIELKVATPWTQLAVSLLACVGILLLWLAPPSQAAFGLAAFDASVEDDSGAAFTQAAGHPYVASTSFDLNSNLDAFGHLTPDGSLRNLRVELPPGFVGAPPAVSKCPGVKDLLLAPDGDTPSCPPASQVGLADLVISINKNVIPAQAPVYAMEPPPGTPAAFGMNIAHVPVILTAEVRSDSDFGLNVNSVSVSQALALLGVTVRFWGAPADPSHDSERRGLGCPAGCPAGIPVRPFLTNPTACTPPGVGLETRARAESWGEPRDFDDVSIISHHPPGYPLPPDQWGPPVGPTDCDRIPFDPSIKVTPGTTVPDAPTGLSVEVSIPQNENPVGLAQGHLKRATVTLPEGMTISPSSASGLQGCSDGALGLGSKALPSCPDGSKLGSVSLVTPLLDEPLEGSIYLRAQASRDPASGEMFRLALVLRNDERGLLIKLPGQVSADPQTGRLEATFDNNPQLPFERIQLRFKGGPRAPLATPETCGTKTVTAEFTSWAGQSVVTSDSFDVECPGATGFSPAFTAGSLGQLAGMFSPFALLVDRADRQRYLQGLSLELPTGLLARLKGVPLCNDRDAAAGACPPGSRVGTATVGAGPGATPFFLQGSVSLTGPYKGGPYGLAVAVPVVAGPFDLGTVVVRQAIFVDPVDAHLTVVSDPMPTIVSGVPVRLRTIDVKVDRSEFTLTPTSCAEKRIDAVLTSIDGIVHHGTQRFQVGGCAGLPLEPRLRLRLTGRRQVVDGKHPGVSAVLRQGPGQANIRKVAVALPLSLALDPENARELCEFEAGQRVACPPSSIIGRARAISPVLTEPLTGPVYFVKNVRIDRRTGRQIRTLPTLLIPLRGEVAIDLRARSSVRRGKLVTTFPAVPDAPVSRFALRLRGGRNGILVVSRGLCGRRQTVSVAFRGHNGKLKRSAVRMATPCRPKRTRGRRSGEMGRSVLRP